MHSVASIDIKGDPNMKFSLNTRWATRLLSVISFTAAAPVGYAQVMSSNVTLMSLAPTLSAVAVPTTFVLGQVINLNGTAKNLAPGSIARISAVSSPCGINRPTGAVLPSATVGSGGEASLQMQAWFNNTSPPPSICKTTFELQAVDRGGKAFTANFNVDFKPVAPVPYTVTNTDVLKSRLNFAPISESGTCSGESDPGDHQVGLRSVGGDIQFNIRSGPSGTKCKWKASAFVLPNGMRLQAARVIQDRGGIRCSAQSPLSNLSFWTLVSQNNPASGTEGTIAGNNPNGAGAPIGVLGGGTVYLECGTTLVNDNHITIKLDSFTFVGPPGLVFP